MTENITFFQILRVNHCQLWQIKDNRSTCLTLGDLQVLYSNLVNLFVLKIDDYQFALDKSLQISGLHNFEENWQAYVWAAFDGFFMLKVVNNTVGSIIVNFETILENATLFNRCDSLCNQLGEFCHEKKKSGSKIKEAFSKIFAPRSEDSHPNQLITRSFNDLMDVDSPAVPIVDIPTSDVFNMKDEVSEAIKVHQNGKYWRSLRPEEKPLKKDDFMEPEEGPRLFRKSSGAENISTVLSAQGQDQQEVVGTENQRLPSYEIEQSRDTLRKGFRKASFNLSDMKDGTELREVIEEDFDFTTGLCSGPNPTAEQLKTRFEFGVLEVKGTGLGKENLEFQKWGSNIANMSEETPRDVSDISRPSSTSTSGNTRETRETKEKGPLTGNLIGSGLPAESLGQTNLG